MTDNAKESLALAERLTSIPRGWLPSCNRDGEAVVNITYTLAEAAMVEAALRLSARQQASVDIGNANRCQSFLSGAERFESTSRALLAKYDIFEKVEG